MNDIDRAQQWHETDHADYVRAGGNRMPLRGIFQADPGLFNDCEHCNPKWNLERCNPFWARALHRMGVSR